VYGIQGTFLNQPGDNVFAFIGTGGRWWPQPQPLQVTGDGKWAANIHFGSYGPHTVCIVQTSELGTDLVLYYRKIHKMNVDQISKMNVDREQLAKDYSFTYPAIDLGALPKGIEPLATVEITVEYPPPAVTV
jgi:hypothetical protein